MDSLIVWNIISVVGLMSNQLEIESLEIRKVIASQFLISNLLLLVAD